MSDALSRAVAEPLEEGFVIMQPRRGEGYRFTADAIALARFACDGLAGKKDARVLDLCSGCGVIGEELAIQGGFASVGAEIDRELYEMSVRSAELNGLSEKVGFVNADVRQLAKYIDALGLFDAAVCNPPFFKADSRPTEIAPAANSEITVAFADIVSAANAFLKPGGMFFFVHTSSRLDEALCLCRDAFLTPKTLIVNESGKTFLARCVKGGKSGLEVKVERFKCFIS